MNPAVSCLGRGEVTGVLGLGVAAREDAPIDGGEEVWLDAKRQQHDGTGYLSCGAALLTYQWSFNIKEGKRGYLLKDTSKENENEDRPNHEVEKPQVEDQEIWISSQL